MVWDALSFYGTTELAIISRHQDYTEYQKHSQENLLPAWKAISDGNGMFIQDNDGCHVNRETKV